MSILLLSNENVFSLRGFTWDSFALYVGVSVRQWATWANLTHGRTLPMVMTTRRLFLFEVACSIAVAAYLV